MNQERMQWLLEAVQNAPRGKLDMTNWCGTAQCASGWLCADPRAQLAGLHTNYIGPYFEGEYMVRALQNFLDISLKEARYIFIPTEYESDMQCKKIPKREVLSHIKRVMKQQH